MHVMIYPYYIVQWKEGRLPCPIQYRHTPIEKQFKNGSIGGSNLKEHRATSPRDAYLTWFKDRCNRTIYIVNQGRPRQKIDPQSLRSEMQKPNHGERK